MTKINTYRKTFVILAAVILSVVLLFGLSHAILYDADHQDSAVRNLNSYRNEIFAGWRFSNPYILFPDESVIEQAQNWKYVYKREHAMIPLLFDNDIVAFLTCRYSPDMFEEECARLEEVSNDKVTEQFREKLPLPNVIYEYGGNTMEYALMEKESHTIYYISYQNRAFSEHYIPIRLLPQNPGDG